MMGPLGYTTSSGRSQLGPQVVFFFFERKSRAVRQDMAVASLVRAQMARIIWRHRRGHHHRCVTEAGISQPALPPQPWRMLRRYGSAAGARHFTRANHRGQ